MSRLVLPARHGAEKKTKKKDQVCKHIEAYLGKHEPRTNIVDIFLNCLSFVAFQPTRFSLILAPRTENERKPRNNYYQMQYKHLDRWGNCAACYSIKKAIEVGWTFVLLIDTVSILCRLVAINCAYGNTNKSADICLFYCRLKFFLLLYLHR